MNLFHTNLQVTKKILGLGKNLKYLTGLLDPFFINIFYQISLRSKLQNLQLKKLKQPNLNENSLHQYLYQ